jgi:hypothetical protein
MQFGVRSWLTISLLFTALAGLLLGLVAVARPDLRERLAARLTGAEAAPEPVLVLVVGHRLNVAALRNSLLDAVVIEANDEAFALESGHIIASRIEAAGPLLNSLGWVDRPLEILDPKRGPPSPRSATSAGSGVLDPRTNPPSGPSLAELARQETLTPDEAQQALRMLR